MKTLNQLKVVQKNSIVKRKRVVRWVDDYPVVRVANVMRRVSCIVSDSTDNPKTLKNNDAKWLASCVVLSPEKSAGVGNLCPFAGVCAETCLDHQGKGAAVGDTGERVHGSRIARTLVWHYEREYFLEQYHAGLEKYEGKAEAKGKRHCHRGNIFSDIAWEKYGVPQAHPNTEFYDYTKDPRRVGQVCDNYWVTFSRDSAKDDKVCIELLKRGCNVAIAFDDGRTSGGRNLHGYAKPLPKTWRGFPVFNGDVSDARWMDPPGHVIGLYLKAHSQEERQKAIANGFALPCVNS